MRELKFRAWDRSDKVMVFCDIEDFVYNTADGIYPRADRYEWMQFTGLKDKNGKEIYEGDIVSPVFNKSPEKVTFEDGRFSTKSGFDKAKVEVIGNIYSNPDLLS